jgi:hypothetical protein
MATVTVQVGSIRMLNSGEVQDVRRDVEFEGEKLAKWTEYSTGDHSNTRGVTETLYEATDGRLVVHVKDWSQWRGEPTTLSLHLVTPADLGPGGKYEFLGEEAGFGPGGKHESLGAGAGLGQPLTLDEALSEAGGDE